MGEVMRWNILRPVIALIAAVTAVAGIAQAQPAPVNNDTPEEIAKDAQRDLKDSRFYNKAGATRAQYDADWQECRLIARGSKIINGNMTYYNPAMYNPSISPIAAGIGGGIGAAIGAAIAEGIQRRENRKRCLMIKGWKLVRLPDDRAAAVAAMSDADKQAYFNRVISADKVEGDVETLDRFSPPEDPALAVTADVVGAPTLFIHKKPERPSSPRSNRARARSSWRSGAMAAPPKAARDWCNCSATTRPRATSSISRATGRRPATRPATRCRSRAATRRPAMNCA
jgi:hypothetical protein